eukprot:4982116-Amphidinium_carterae.2
MSWSWSSSGQEGWKWKQEGRKQGGRKQGGQKKGGLVNVGWTRGGWSQGDWKGGGWWSGGKTGGDWKEGWAASSSIDASGLQATDQREQRRDSLAPSQLGANTTEAAHASHDAHRNSRELSGRLSEDRASRTALLARLGCQDPKRPAHSEDFAARAARELQRFADAVSAKDSQALRHSVEQAWEAEKEPDWVVAMKNALSSCCVVEGKRFWLNRNAYIEFGVSPRNIPALSKNFFPNVEMDVCLFGKIVRGQKVLAP